MAGAGKNSPDRKFKCPRCKKSISFPGDWDSGYCGFCGQHLDLREQGGVPLNMHDVILGCPYCKKDIRFRELSLYEALEK